jgi:hypothetical protein
MSENVLAKLTSPKWLREAISGRARNILNSFNFSPFIIEREVAGEKHRFYIGNVTEKSWYDSNTDISYETSFVRRELVRPGAVVIECGAHHGAQSILLSRWVVPDGKVVAIEPMPQMRRSASLPREGPRLCRRGSKSLKSTGETSHREPPTAP